MPPKRAAAPATGFTGFPRATLPFFADLAANNDRDWFNANRATYDAAVHAPLVALVEAVSFALAVHDVPLHGDAKSLFRINRDIRFAKDKSPYKTNASAVLSRDGIKGSRGILYVQVGGGSMMAAGFYGPEPADLAALRHAIADQTVRWRKVVAALDTAGLALSTEATLVRMPRGFEDHADGDLADVLRLKNLVVTAPIAAARLHEAAVIDDIVAFARATLPLLEFGWSALSRVAPR